MISDVVAWSVSDGGASWWETSFGSCFRAAMSIARRAIERVERAIKHMQQHAKHASANQQLADFEAKAVKTAWDTLNQLGRLLYFLRFGKQPFNSSAGEVALYDWIADELNRLGALERRADAPTTTAATSVAPPGPQGRGMRVREVVWDAHAATGCERRNIERSPINGKIR